MRFVATSSPAIFTSHFIYLPRASVGCRWSSTCSAFAYHGVTVCRNVAQGLHSLTRPFTGFAVVHHCSCFGAIPEDTAHNTDFVLNGTHCSSSVCISRSALSCSHISHPFPHLGFHLFPTVQFADFPIFAYAYIGFQLIWVETISHGTVGWDMFNNSQFNVPCQLPVPGWFLQEDGIKPVSQGFCSFQRVPAVG